MKSLTTDKKIAIGIVIAMFATFMAIFSLGFGSKVAHAFGIRYLPDQTVATTTPYQTFMKGASNATATTTVNTDGSQDLTLFVMLGSSTTPPVLNYRVQYSPYQGIDCMANSLGCTWYDADVALTSSATTTVHVQSGLVDNWVYSSTTANQNIVNGANNVKFITKRIVITALDSTYTRIVWVNSGGDALLNVIPSVKNQIFLPK